jgi:leucyl aminopeptidase
MEAQMSPDVVVLPSAISSLDAEWVFIPVARDETSVPVDGVDAATGGELSRAILSGEFKAKEYRVFATPVTGREWRARRIALVGAGGVDRFDAMLLRRLASVAGLFARDRKAVTAAFVCRQPPRASASGADLSPATLAQAIAEGLMFATFDAAAYKTEDHDVWEPKRFIVSLPGIDEGTCRGASEAVHRGVVLSECTNMSRELANEPGNRLRPREFADRAAHLASKAGLRAAVLDEAEIAELGMGLLLGVARGSEEPPRLLVIEHLPPEAPAAGPILGLVGKGVTFDTGGLSIKPSQGMERMKDDMAGGAAVIGALNAIARLSASVRVIGIVPIAENMPSGHAIRPGDVLRSASGKTVEVLDTDAEGRLILGDALWYARQRGATHLVDIATLTGACMVALGHAVSGLFARPREWAQTVQGVADRAGDRVWPMPLHEDYFDMLKSDIADLKNVGGRPAGAITAAIFLEQFVGNGPWAHLDIAGTAWNEDAKEYLPKGPTGAGVKTLATLAFTDLP